MIHTLYIETIGDLTGQDVVMAIEGAFTYAIEDYRNCIEDGVDPEDEECYKRKIDILERIHILEDEPEPPFDPWGSEEDFPKKDWVYEVMNEDTTLGYVDWVLAKREEKELDDEQN